MKNYKVNNKNLYREVIVCQATGKITEELGYMFLHMAKKLKRKFKHRDEDIDDVINHAILDALNSINKYDKDISDNVFAYFTQVIKTGIVRGYNKLHKKVDVYRFEVEIPLFSATPEDYGDY